MPFKMDSYAEERKFSRPVIEKKNKDLAEVTDLGSCDVIVIHLILSCTSHAITMAV